ncbi:hypothetical protein N658DRAFT_510535 [Parathielavia hyrcaniae]|uniref:DUF7053 domain-containing protein n=1 Tax=Parathielavia hyrcaniae TaxID=113614 RepID=A0AAN6SY29_9PEZI|nr:hypothetical protein N658DRAFT_510535 [Parathielavia hyrcaniae]
MLRKKDVFTVINPIPGFIPRQLAIDILHSHSEVITLNPLVLSHKPIPAPQNAETDEYYSTWYEITERIQLVPGIGKMGASVIKFNGCFHDMPWGLQTHIYAPMNIDLRHKYRIAGNQPGVESPEVPEIGSAALGVPADGLYLRQDIEIKCNITMLSFVKSQMKKAGGEMVQRMIKKAELLDAGILQAMIEDGKLKTINPADRSTSLRSPLPSPTSLRYSPSVTGSPPVGTSPTPYQVPRVESTYAGYQYKRPGTSGSHRSVPPHLLHPGAHGLGVHDGPQELPTEVSSPPAPVEMPGDFVHASPNQQPERQSPRHAPTGSPLQSPRESLMDPTQRASASASPNPSAGGQWANPGSRPASHTSSLGSPGLLADGKGFAQPLASHQETREEHQAPPLAPYNPADYAKLPPGQPQYTTTERTELTHSRWFLQEGGSCNVLHGTRPSTAGFAHRRVARGPAGADLCEKLWEWTDEYFFGSTTRCQPRCALI